jgi:uncharacterized membrane protein YsdA (DUF1294 family)
VLEALDRKTPLLVVMAVLIVMNLVSFALMGIDKRRAQRGAWRISEKALFLTTACFGGLGGFLGMKVFHHKTKHWYFRVFFPVLLVVQIVILAIGAYHFS